MGLPQHGLMLRVVRSRSQFGTSRVFWIIDELIWRSWHILVQSVFIVNTLLLCHWYSRLRLRWVYAFNPPTVRSATRRQVLLPVKTASPCFRLQFPVFLYAPGANGGLHWLLPWKFPSFKISACWRFVYFFDRSWLKNRYFHSIFQVLLFTHRFSNLRTKRFHVTILVPARILRVMCLNCVLQRFAILCSFLFIFAWSFVALQNYFEDFIVPSSCLCNLILREFLRIVKLRILMLYLDLLEILNGQKLLHGELLLRRQ